MLILYLILAVGNYVLIDSKIAKQNTFISFFSNLPISKAFTSLKDSNQEGALNIITPFLITTTILYMYIIS